MSFSLTHLIKKKMFLLKLQLEWVLEVHILIVSSKALTYRFENCQIRCNKNFALKLMNIPIPRFSLKFWRVWSSSGTLNEIYAYIYLVFHLEEAFGFKKTHESCVRGTERSRTPDACSLHSIKSRKFSLIHVTCSFTSMKQCLVKYSNS